ncbi:MAG: hypothetical protein N3D16_02810, partial [Anaerolineales bacterium]|nr:hypothetical protein [Anaerolineales bacterium]
FLSQQRVPEKENASPGPITLTQATDTPVPLPTDTPTITATATRNYQATLSVRETNIAATATRGVLMKTQSAKPMAELVENFYQDGYLASKEGTFIKMDDFNEQWAKLDWYQYWYQGDEEYANFVLSFSAKMQSASDKANWHHAGCGLVFRHVDNDNHMFLIIAQNGIMSLRKRIKDVVYLVRDSKKYGSQIPVENVFVNLIVDGMNVYVFADGVPILEAREPILGSTLRKGRLAFSVMSGTNKGYGTRCSMTDIWLWELK